MREFKSRKDRNTEMLDAFSKNSEKESITMKLYSREIKNLTSSYPQLKIQKGARYLETDLFICTICKM